MVVLERGDGERTPGSSGRSPDPPPGFHRLALVDRAQVQAVKEMRGFAEALGQVGGSVLFFGSAVDQIGREGGSVCHGLILAANDKCLHAS